MTNQFKVGPNTVEVDEQGNVISARTGETRMFLRPDDGITGKLPVTRENGHDGMQVRCRPILPASRLTPLASSRLARYAAGSSQRLLGTM
jgi:hypothetical protein